MFAIHCLIGKILINSVIKNNIQRYTMIILLKPFQIMCHKRVVGKVFYFKFQSIMHGLKVH